MDSDITVLDEISKVELGLRTVILNSGLTNLSSGFRYYSVG